METTAFVFAPVLVALLTSLAKWAVPVLANSSKTVLRLVVAVLAFGTTLVEASLNGSGLDASAIDIMAVTVVNALGATGAWHLWKNK